MRQDADNRIGLAFELDGSSDHVGVSVKGRLPESIAQDNDGRPMRTIFFFAEASAEVERDAKNVKILRGNTAIVHITHRAARIGSHLEVDPIVAAPGGKGDRTYVILQELPGGAVKAVVLFCRRLVIARIDAFLMSCLLYTSCRLLLLRDAGF